jgi:hypothetical protein
MAAKAKSSRTIPPLVVRYPRRMKPQKVYSVQVSWQSREKKAGIKPYTVRLVMAGAQVIPSEQVMDPAKPTSRAIFYVTPLVRKGWLKGERLEILADEEKVQEIGLPAKVASQRKTWILLLLTFLIPWFLINHVQISEEEYFKNKQQDAWQRMVQGLEQNTPLGVVLTPEIKESLGQAVGTVGLSETALRGAYNWIHRILARDEIFLESGTYDVFLPFWVGTSLFVLTLLSWWWHREKYSRRTGKPLPAVSAEEDEE